MHYVMTIVLFVFEMLRVALTVPRFSRHFSAMTAGVKRVPSIFMQNISQRFQGKGRIIVIEKQSEGTRVDFHDTVKHHTTFGFVIETLHHERLGLESTAPRVTSFFDNVFKNMEKQKLIMEVNADTNNLFKENSMDNLDLSLKEMKNHAGKVTHAFDKLAKKIGNDDYCFWDVNMEVINRMGWDEEKVHLQQLHKYISDVNVLVGDCVLAMHKFFGALYLFKNSYDYATQMMDILDDECRIIKALTINGWHYVPKGISHDLAELQKLQDILKERRLTHPELLKMASLTEKWANYIEACGKVKIGA